MKIAFWCDSVPVSAISSQSFDSFQDSPKAGNGISVLFFFTAFKKMLNYTQTRITN